MAVLKARLLDQPRTSLLLFWLGWKLILILLTLSAPGPGYDTSTFLLEGWAPDLQPVRVQHGHHQNASPASHWYLAKFVRWDAIYFSQIAEWGYVYEQEWAFGWGFTRLISQLRRAFDLYRGGVTAINTVAAGLLLANAAHLISTLILYELTCLIFESLPAAELSLFSLISACLYIISPAGLFLTAPYAESFCAALTFLGFYFYVQSSRPEWYPSWFVQGLLLTLCGLSLGAAATIRGNGILNGLVLVHEAARLIWKILSQGRLLDYLPRLTLVTSAGILMGSISIIPQYFAFLEYCSHGEGRPWCNRWIPSIYAWVQTEYWGNGLFRYWTFSNLPLYLLAIPMLSIMLWSGRWAWSSSSGSRNHASVINTNSPRQTVPNKARLEDPLLGQWAHREQNSIQQLAIPQIVLAVLTLFCYHVQIITRLSTGYPLWYWWLAWSINSAQEVEVWGKKLKPSLLIVRWMVIYAIIQGGLFASFLPPA